jgi:hypothetical protein
MGKNRRKPKEQRLHGEKPKETKGTKPEEKSEGTTTHQQRGKNRRTAWEKAKEIEGTKPEEKTSTERKNRRDKPNVEKLKGQNWKRKPQQREKTGRDNRENRKEPQRVLERKKSKDLIGIRPARREANMSLKRHIATKHYLLPCPHLAG